MFEASTSQEAYGIRMSERHRCNHLRLFSAPHPHEIPIEELHVFPEMYLQLLVKIPAKTESGRAGS